MMSAVIHQETVVFFLSVLHGAALTLGYDVLRAFRTAFHHNTAAVSLEDFLFWLTAGFLTFCLAFFYTDGVIRGYVAAGMAIGSVLYHYTLSTLTVRILSGLLQGGKRLILCIFDIVSMPVRKICLLLKKVIEFVGKKGYNKIKKKVRGNFHGRKKKTAKQK